MAFAEDVYEIVKNIPYGKVASYGQVASMAGRPRNARVVGYALHRNPEPDVIPCHRVVFVDGSVCTGYACLLYTSTKTYVTFWVNMSQSTQP